MKELAALAYRDTTAENREYWKNEMGQALREIQQVYEDKLDTMRTEIEASYSLKVTSLFHTIICIVCYYILQKSTKCFLNKNVCVVHIDKIYTLIFRRFDYLLCSVCQVYRLHAISVAVLCL